MRSRISATCRFTAFFAVLALVSPFFVLNISAQQMTRNKMGSLTEDQKILHVLNRLGFGAKAGDVAMVKSIGLKQYIEQQLNPESIAGTAVAAKLENFEILKMGTTEIFAKYPNPGALLRRLERNEQNGRNSTARSRQNNQAMMMDGNGSEQA